MEGVSMKKVSCVYWILIVVLCAGLACSSETPEKTEVPVRKAEKNIPVDEIFTYAQKQLARSVELVGDADKYPFYAKDDGTWETMDSSWWSSGFFAGCLWLMYENTGDDIWKQHAEKWTTSMEKEQYVKADADIGYRIINSYGNAYRVTGDESYRKVLIESAKSLASRYSSKIGLVKAYDMDQWKYPILIDHMMNVELMFIGTNVGGDPQWKEQAEQHGLNTIRTCIREDGSSVQVVDLDPNTGEVLSHDTLCGLSGDSAWSRGHGEGIYGMAIAYRETKNTAFVDAFKTLVDYYIANMPADYVPFWDFSDPNIPNTIRDSSAASMTADGLLEMCALLPDGPDKEKYFELAGNILESLCANYLTTGTNRPGILDNASFQGPEVMGADTSLIFGDYNFLSALKKYKALKG